MQLPDTLPRLMQGGHPSGSGELCAMEAASWLLGEPHCANPRGVDQHLAGALRNVNDVLPDEPRQRLWSYIYRALDTRNDCYEWDMIGCTKGFELHNSVMSGSFFSRMWTEEKRVKDVFKWLDSMFEKFEEITGRKTSSVPQLKRLTGANTVHPGFREHGMLGVDFKLLTSVA